MLQQWFQGPAIFLCHISDQNKSRTFSDFRLLQSRKLYSKFFSKKRFVESKSKMPRKKKRKLDGGSKPAKKRRKVNPKKPKTQKKQKPQKKRKRKLESGAEPAKKRIKLDEKEEKKDLVIIYINDINTQEYELCNKIPNLTYMNAMFIISGRRYKSESDFIQQWEHIGITRQLLRENHIKISTKIRSKVFSYSCVNCGEKIHTTQQFPNQSHPIYNRLQNKHYYRYTQHGVYHEEPAGKRIYYHRKSAEFGDMITCHKCYYKMP